MLAPNQLSLTPHLFLFHQSTYIIHLISRTRRSCSLCSSLDHSLCLSHSLCLRSFFSVLFFSVSTLLRSLPCILLAPPCLLLNSFRLSFLSFPARDGFVGYRSSLELVVLAAVGADFHFTTCTMSFAHATLIESSGSNSSSSSQSIDRE